MTDLIRPNDQRDILICAFRYALGRCTYITHTVAEAIKHAWPQLSAHDRELYQREIRQAIEMDRAGHSCDVASWESILKLDD